MYDSEWEQIASKLLDNLEQDAVLNQDEATAEMTPAQQINDVQNEHPHSANDTIALLTNMSPVEGASANFSKKIQELDPKYNLSIYRYLKYVHEDPIVLEYCEKLIELNFIPCEPHSLELKYFSKRVQKFEVSAKCQNNCVLMLVSYFKCCDIEKKLKIAENTRSPLFEVTTNPEFFGSQSLFTIAGHDRLSTLRNCLCIQTQRAASIENQFVMELLLIRVYHCLMKDIQYRKNVLEIAPDYVKSLFMVMYLLVKSDYETDINLTGSNSAESHPDPDLNLPIYPKWRLEGNNPPLCFEVNASKKMSEYVKQFNFKKFDVSQAIEKLSKLNKL